MTSRAHWRCVDGVLLLDKPVGVTSNSALQTARRLFRAAKAGHTGTLDPLASGLLPVCFGQATKFAVDLLAADKTYEADLRFGVQTATGDAEGAIVRCRPVAFGRTAIEAILPRFRGRLQQIPPMYSALKHSGTPLYDLARQGIEVDRAARTVTIHELTVLGFADDCCRLRIACSKGTYVRTLAEDLGEALGCGAHLTALRRIAVGALHIADSFTLDRLAELSEEARASCLLAPDVLLQSLPALCLDEQATPRFLHGNPVGVNASPGKWRVYGAQGLLGLGEVDQLGSLQPRRVIAPVPPA